MKGRIAVVADSRVHGARVPPVAERSLTGSLLLAVAVAVGVSACTGPNPIGGGPAGSASGSGGRWGMMGGPGMYGGQGMMAGGPMSMHGWATTQGIPGEYTGMRDPLPDDPQVVAEGKTLFRTNCAACHGENAAGDGPAAAGMSPPPADLRAVMHRPMTGDGYLMWAISDGARVRCRSGLRDAGGCRCATAFELPGNGLPFLQQAV